MAFTGTGSQILSGDERDERAEMIRNCEVWERAKNRAFPGITPEVAAILGSFDVARIIPGFSHLKNCSIEFDGGGNPEITFRTYESASIAKAFIGAEIGAHYAGLKIRWNFFRSIHKPGADLEELRRRMNGTPVAAAIAYTKGT